MAKGFKTGGRQLGTPNRVTSEMRDRLTLIVNDEIDLYANKRTQNDLPGARLHLDAIRSLLPYVMPKLPNEDCDRPPPIVIPIHANL